MAERLFGTNGVRGVLGTGRFTLRLVHDLSAALAGHFGGGPILVGRDGRASSVPISRAVRAALSMAGADSTDAGLVPTPCLQYAVKRLGYRGGIMVTASHNPPEYGGIKPVEADGVEPSRAAEVEIEKRCLEAGSGGPRGRIAGEPPARPAAVGPPARLGRIRDGDGGEAVEAYLAGIVSLVDADAIRRRAPAVAIDAGNGAQAAVAPELCRRLGCRSVKVVNGGVDPRFPGRGPEPTPENLGGLSRAVAESGADVGVAFDGDGDRSLFCDERGAVLTGDRSALLLAGRLLSASPGSTVVTCLNSGSAIESVAAASGSRVVRTRVGSVEVSRAMAGSGALAGFEENGGFMYGRHNAVRDGAMTLALVLDLLASGRAGTLSEAAAALPPSFTAKDKVPCGSADAARVALSAMASGHPGADTTDGVKAGLGEGRWVMVRASGTEPILRVYAEGRSQADLDAIMSEYVGRVRSLAVP